jgi:hypothetical protein
MGRTYTFLMVGLLNPAIPAGALIMTSISQPKYRLQLKLVTMLVLNISVTFFS